MGFVALPLYSWKKVFYGNCQKIYRAGGDPRYLNFKCFVDFHLKRFKGYNGIQWDLRGFMRIFRHN